MWWTGVAKIAVIMVIVGSMRRDHDLYLMITRIMGEDGGMSAGGMGQGLAKGLAVTLKTMTRRSTTQQYPDVAPELPPRSRGVIALLEENCTVCMLCARECPDWCIYIDSHKEEVAVPGAARPRQRNVLDKFDIDFSLCMYCGICIEACPFDALYWTPEFEYAEYDLRDLLQMYRSMLLQG